MRDLHHERDVTSIPPHEPIEEVRAMSEILLAPPPESMIPSGEPEFCGTYHEGHCPLSRLYYWELSETHQKHLFPSSLGPGSGRVAPSQWFPQRLLTSGLCIGIGSQCANQSLRGYHLCVRKRKKNSAKEQAPLSHTAAPNAWSLLNTTLRSVWRSAYHLVERPCFGPGSERAPKAPATGRSNTKEDEHNPDLQNVEDEGRMRD
ncbi:hypothetical protein R3P38DRAFT_2759967 [Favolaschia claudopus]|uniref:Uncharacterized protein n=1 Tax=Favolaschia claudopus TaxID=2862362 RepID=A0AAW0E2K0_9AGAR